MFSTFNAEHLPLGDAVLFAAAWKTVARDEHARLNENLCGVVDSREGEREKEKSQVMPRALCIQSKRNHHRERQPPPLISKNPIAKNDDVNDDDDKEEEEEEEDLYKNKKTTTTIPLTSTATGVVVAGACCIVGVAIIISCGHKTRDVNTTTTNIQNVPFDTSSLFPKKKNKKMNKTLNTRTLLLDYFGGRKEKTKKGFQFSIIYRACRTCAPRTGGNRRVFAWRLRSTATTRYVAGDEDDEDEAKEEGERGRIKRRQRRTMDE